MRIATTSAHVQITQYYFHSFKMATILTLKQTKLAGLVLTRTSARSLSTIARHAPTEVAPAHVLCASHADLLSVLAGLPTASPPNDGALLPAPLDKMSGSTFFVGTELPALTFADVSSARLFAARTGEALAILMPTEC